MDGLLVIDKPAGPTSHDVVARIRRVLREPRVGHTGTLDPMATGVLALVVGKATRLAQFLSGSDKSYDAVVRLGFATDTGDAQGAPIGEVRSAVRSREEIDGALHAFRGTFMQQPPAFSAKMIDGTRSHKLARARRRGAERVLRDISQQQTLASEQPTSSVADSAMPAPTSVSTTAIEILSIDGDLVTLRVDCSAGFYVRSLAHDLGETLGTGAHLAALRRTRNGDATLDDAIPLDVAEDDSAAVRDLIVPLSRMLTSVPGVTLAPDGVLRAVHGRDVGPGFGIRDAGCDPGEPRITRPQSRVYRLLDDMGSLVAIAVPSSTPGLLHPSVVLV